MLGRRGYGNDHALSSVYGAGGGPAVGWMGESDYADAAVVADFNRGLYALPQLSSELIQNGNFADGTNNWLPAAGANLTAANNEMTVTSTSLNFASGRQSIAAAVGDILEISYEGRRVNGNAGWVIAGNSEAGQADAYFIQSLAPVWTRYTHRILATGNGFNIRGQTHDQAIGNAVAIRNVSVKRYTLDEVGGQVPKRVATFDEIFAFTASSTEARSYWDAAGQFKNDLAANQPRFCWRSGKRQLRLEDQRTNLVTNNKIENGVPGRVGVDAVAPTGWSFPAIAGGTANLVIDIAYGIEDGLSYMEVTASYQNNTAAIVYPAILLFPGSVALAEGAPVALSALIKTLEVPTGISCRLQATNNLTAGSNHFFKNLPNVVTGKYVRHTVDGVGFPNSQSVSQLRLQWDVPVGAAFTAKFRIQAPQLELAAFASDPILVNGAAVTRAVESARFSPLVEMIARRATTSYRIQGRLTGVNPGNAARIIGAENSYGVNRRTPPNEAEASTTFGASNDGFTRVAPGSGDFSNFGIAAGHSSTDSNIAFNGNIGAQSAMASGIYQLNERYLGRMPAETGAYANGFYDNVVIYPKRLTNARLQSLAKAAA